MENIGDYAYIIFLLVVFLLQTVFGKKKKPAGEPRKKQGKTLEDILGELMGEEKKHEPQNSPVPPVAQPVAPVKPKPKPAPRPSMVINTEDQPVNEYMAFMQRKKEGTQTGTYSGKPLEVVDLDDEPAAEKQHFNLRQAVISQVVLERKYF